MRRTYARLFLERRLEAERSDDAAGHGVHGDHLGLEVLFLREHHQGRGEVLRRGGEENSLSSGARLRIFGSQHLRRGARRQRVAEPAGHVLVLGVAFFVVKFIRERGRARHLRGVSSLRAGETS